MVYCRPSSSDFSRYPGSKPDTWYQTG